MRPPAGSAYVSLRALPSGPCHKKPQIAFLNNRIIIVFEFKDMSQ